MLPGTACRAIFIASCGRFLSPPFAPLRIVQWVTHLSGLRGACLPTLSPKAGDKGGAPSAECENRGNYRLQSIVSNPMLRRVSKALSALREPTRIAFDSMRVHKLRTFLTLLGIILSVSTLIVVISMIEGTNH